MTSEIMTTKTTSSKITASKTITGLYVVTDESLSRGKTHVEIAREAIQGGADIIQLRDKNMDSGKLLSVAKEIMKIEEVVSHKVLFFVNDRLDIALAAKAHGVHLGQSDIPAMDARRIVPTGFLIGVSVGSVDEAKKAVLDGADYVAISPIFDTTSKNDAGFGHGLETAKAICEAVSVPIVAIGGINRDNISDIIDAGVDSVAVISAVVSQKDISASATELSLIIKEAKEKRKARVNCENRKSKNEL